MFPLFRRMLRRLTIVSPILALGLTLFPSAATAQALLNASFETPAYASVGRNATPAGASWTFTGTAGIERLQLHYQSNNSGGYNGLQAAYLSSTGTAGSLGTIAQTVNFPAAGQYSLRFLAGRLGAANALRITVGGVQIESDLTPRALGATGYPQLESWWTLPFTLAAAGDYEIKFAATQAGATLSGGNVLLVDQVTVTSVQFSLPNASFETTTGSAPVVATGWTLTNSTVGAAPAAGAAGANAIVLGADSVTGKAQAVSVTVPVGRYSISARVANSGASTSCTPTFGYTVGGTSTPLASLPTPVYNDLIPYTSASFDLAAGTYAFYLSAACGSGATPPVIDAIIVNRAGPNFANASFETPDIGLPADPYSTPRQFNPAGSSWSYTGSVSGIRSNSGSATADFPYTEAGKQYGFSLGGGSTFSQSVVLDAGTYVVVSKASVGSFALTVNGTPQAITQRGSRSRAPDGYNFMFSEVQSEPFTVATTGAVTLGFSPAEFTPAGFSIDVPRIIQIGGNPPPVVSIALQVNGVAAPAAVAPGGTLTATATASDSNGLQRIRVLRNGLPLAPENTATPPASATSPLTVTVSSLTAGSYTFTAEATDHLGATSTASQMLTVLANASITNGSFEAPVLTAATYSYLPTGAEWQFLGSAGIQRNGSAFSAPSAPDGFQTGFLQCAPSASAGSISQSVAFATASVFRVSFQLASRPIYGPQAIQVSLDGVNQGAAISPSSTTFANYSTGDINVTAGVHTLKISASQCDTDRTSFIDTVQLTLVNAPPTFSAFSVTPTATQVAATALTLGSTAADPDVAGYVSTIDYQYRLPGAGTYTTISGQNCVNTPGSPLRPFSCNGKTWTPPAGTGGQYALSALAIDNLGASTRSNEITVSVCGPKAALTLPASGATYSVVAGGQASVTYTAQVGQYSTDPTCGTLSKVEFLLDGVALPDVGATITPTAGVTTYSFTKNLPVRAQAYQLSVRVSEAGVRTATSQPSVAVTVIANAPPVIQSVAVGAGGALTGVATSIAVQISDDANLSSSALTLSPSNTMAGATINCPGGATQNCSVTWTPPTAGVYTLGLRLTDAGGASVDSNTTIAVSEAPAASALSLPTTAAIGTSAGQFSVSESGAATYSLPIAVAPGVNGVQPNLALTYNSQGGDGNLGVGWNLSGTSSITRCPKTIATDGVREPINYDNITDPFTGNDAFCLDGQRLIPISGGLTQVSCPNISGVITSGQCKAWEFRTELESYSRIIAISDNADATGTSSGSGPTRFRVYTKSGQILEYGSRWWGIGAPRPDPQTSFIVNPGFEDTVLTDSCWITGSTSAYYYDASGNWVPNPCYGNATVPQNWSGFGASSPLGYFKTVTTGASSNNGWTFSVDSVGNAGVQRNYSAMSPQGPATAAADGTQSAFLQQTGRTTTVLHSLDAGIYKIGFKLAGRSSSDPGYGGNQLVEVQLDGVAQASFQVTTGQAFTPYTVYVTVGTGDHTLSFVGKRQDDQTALLDAVTLIPVNQDILSLKVFPLDRLEDRSGNYMHIDYGGSHENQVLVYPDGSVQSVQGTVLSSFGNASLPPSLPASSGRVALIAQGARPAFEMYPRRLTYGMRTATPGAGNNLSSVGSVEMARVILNYLCIDGTLPASDGSCKTASGVTTGYDTGAGQMLRSKRLASILSLVGGSDDTSLPGDRDNFHWNEMTNGQYGYGAQCTDGTQTACGTLVRKYLLGYEQSSSTQRIRLNSVTECAGDGACLPATTFAWQDSTQTLAGTGSGSGPANFNDLYAQGQVADVVGDGRSRLVVRRSNTQLDVCEISGGSVACTSRFMPAGYYLPDAQSSDDHAWSLADVDGDAVADILVTPRSANGTRAFACTLPAAATTYQCAELPPKQGIRGGSNSPDVRYHSKTGDFNGDGRIDVAFYRGNGVFEVCLAPFNAANCTLAALSGLNISFANPATEVSHQVIADFNGDGRADIAYRVSRFCVEQPLTYYDQANNRCLAEPSTDDMYWSVCFASGADNAMRFQCATRSGANLIGAVKTVPGEIKKIANFDLNGDGLADFASAVTINGVTKWRVCLSTGDGEFARDPNGGGECPLWSGPTGGVDKTVVGDFNGDGRSDLAVFKSGADGQPGIWEVCLSNGAGFALPCKQVTGPAKPADCGGGCNQVFPGDFNGDGKTDLAVNGYNTNGQLFFGLPESTMPDLLSTVTTGLGAQTRVLYEPLSKPGGVYTKNPIVGVGDPDPGSVAANEIVIQSPMYVVSRTLASTGDTTSFYKTTYAYNSLRADKWGRGLSGFYRRNITENQVADVNGNDIGTQQPHVTGFITNLSWPNVGRPRVIAKVVGGVTLSSSTMEYASRSNATGINRTNGVGGQYQRWEAFQSKSTQNPNLTDTDLDGISKQPRITTYTGFDPAANAVNLAAFYDAFANPLQVISKTEHPTNGEVWTQTVSNGYYSGGGDTTRWLLGKLQTATTTTAVSGYTTNGATTVPRKSSFTYHGYGGSCTGAVYGQLCSETIEPDAYSGSTAPYDNRTLWQQSAYEYDAFGNRTRSTVSYYDDNLGTGGLKSRQSDSTYLLGKYPNTITRRFVAGSTSTRDLSETRSYDDSRCRMATKVTDANGNYATTEYDGFCRKVRESAWTNDAKLAKQSSFTLTTTGISGQEKYALETRSSDVTNADRRTTLQFYDNLQRVVRAQARAFDGTYSESSSYFDALGRQRCVAKQVSGGSSTTTASCNGTSWSIAAGSSVSRLDYDALNRVVTETLPDGNTAVTTYAGLTTTVTRSNSNGTVNGTIGSAQAHVTRKTANAKGLVASVLANPGGSLTTTASYVYDAIGNLTQVTTPAANSSTLTKSMGYDLRDRQTSLTDPDAGSYSYAYNGVGDQVSQTDARGFVTATSYDGFGRKTSRTETQAVGGNASTTWTYDTCGNGSTSRAAGLLCSVGYSGTGGSANATSKATAYDQYARPVTTTTQIAGKSFTSQVAYDSNGRPQYAIYPQATAASASLATQTVFNDRGYAYQTKHALTGFIYQTISSRNADGQLNQASLGGGLLTQSNSYATDGLARIQTINVTLSANASNVLSQSFGFESIGNLNSRTLIATGRNESEAFSYDVLDRLTANAGTGLSNSPADTGSYTIDVAGNLTSKAGLALSYATGSNALCAIGASTSCSRVVSNAALTLGDGSLLYDSSGNLRRYTRPSNAAIPGADGATLLLDGYSAFNLPTSISKSVAGSVTASAEFAYDAGYQRIRQVKRSGPIGSGAFADDILYVVPGGFEVHRDASGNVISSIATVGGADGVVATVTMNFDPASGQTIILNTPGSPYSTVSGLGTITKLLLKDHLSSMVAEVLVMGSAGAPSVGTIQIHGFGPWGNARSGVNGDNRGFTGHEHLAELGLIHMNGRLYDPVIGRFLQADPIIQAPHNAQSHNRYSYVMNNPLSFTDPSGFSRWTTWRTPIIGVVAGIITGGLAAGWMSAYALANSTATIFATAAGGLTKLGVVAAAAAGGFAAGGVQGGNIQSALKGAFMAALTAGVVQGITDVIGGAGGTGAEAASGGAQMGAPTAAADTSTMSDASNTGMGSSMPTRLDSVLITGSNPVPIGQYSGFANIWNNYILNPANVVGVGVAGAFTTRAATSASPWLLKPFARGQAIETSLGQNLPKNFPVIDKFENGVATSIKSLDVNAASYQNAATLSRTLGGYIDDVAAFNGRSWAGVQISPGDILARGLDLAIPNAGNAAQQLVFQQSLLNAAAKSVALRILIVP